jgi:hypothetical protein
MTCGTSTPEPAGFRPARAAAMFEARGIVASGTDAARIALAITHLFALEGRVKALAAR